MVKEIFKQDAYAKSCEATVTAVDERGIRLDRTVFFAPGGGQPGDAGILRLADGRSVPIVETRRNRETGEYLHVPAAGADLPAVGARVVAEINWPRRHRMFLHYSEFPLSVRTLFTATLVMLGIGYLFAMVQIYEVDAGRDGRPGLSAEDIAIAYSGNKKSTKLESALSGPMSGMLPAAERSAIIAWVLGGLKHAEYDTRIKPVVQRRCLACHDGSNPHIPNLNGYENISKVAQIDTGMSIATLVRVSHIHMFGITFIFFLTGLIFTHSYMRPVWLKSVIIGWPFFSMIIDVGSWYLTKINTVFAWAVIVGGALMGLSFATQWIVSMYQIWFYKYEAPNNPVKDTLG